MLLLFLECLFVVPYSLGILGASKRRRRNGSIYEVVDRENKIVDLTLTHALLEEAGDEASWVHALEVSELNATFVRLV